MHDFDPELYGTRWWITKDGRKIQLREMGVAHLSNTYHMLRRNTEAAFTQAAMARVLGKPRVYKQALMEYEAKKKRAESFRLYINWRVKTEYPTGE